MRKVTATIVGAFLAHHPAAAGNNNNTDGEALFLHGHEIARHGEHDSAAGVFLTLAGWNTSTTKERLRGVITMMGHQGSLVDGRPVLAIWTARGQTLIGDPRQPNREAMDMDPTDVIFVAHPATARGLEALAKVPAAGGR